MTKDKNRNTLSQLLKVRTVRDHRSLNLRVFSFMLVCNTLQKTWISSLDKMDTGSGILDPLLERWDPGSRLERLGF